MRGEDIAQLRLFVSKRDRSVGIRGSCRLGDHEHPINKFDSAKIVDTNGARDASVVVFLLRFRRVRKPLNAARQATIQVQSLSNALDAHTPPSQDEYRSAQAHPQDIRTMKGHWARRGVCVRLALLG